MSRHLFILFIGLTALLVLAANYPWHLDDYDEAKQVFTSFEIMRTGHVLYQHSPDGANATKPPLMGWLTTACYPIAPRWNLAARLPSLMAWALLAGLIYQAGRRFGGTEIANLALAIFTLNILTLRIATLARTDMLLAFLCGVCGLITLRVLQEARPWRATEKWLYFCCLLAALMTKGPVAYVFILPGPTLYYLSCRPTGQARTLFPGWAAILIPLAVFLTWVAGGVWTQPGFADEVVIREFLARLDAGQNAVHSSKPFWLYPVVLFLKMAPWSLVCLILLWPKMRNPHKPVQPPMRLLLCWLAGGIVLMSLIPSKRIDRIYPLVVPASLLLAMIWPTPHRRWTTAALWSTLTLFGLYTGGKIIQARQQHTDGLITFGREAASWADANDYRIMVHTASAYSTGMNLYANTLESGPVETALGRWRHREPLALIIDERFLPELPPNTSVLLTSSNYFGRERHHYLVAPATNTVSP